MLGYTYDSMAFTEAKLIMSEIGLYGNLSLFTNWVGDDSWILKTTFLPTTYEQMLSSLYSDSGIV